MSSDVYKERLTTIRNQQKQMIKQDIAASGNTDWTVNNNKAKGRKMVNDMKKLLLRAFNSECDETIGKVKYNNIETSVRKIVKSAEQIQKLGTNRPITSRHLKIFCPKSKNMVRPRI